jgi:hypothetical protein
LVVRRYRGARAERAEQFNQSLKMLGEHPRLMIELLHATILIHTISSATGQFCRFTSYYPPSVVQ